MDLLKGEPVSKFLKDVAGYVTFATLAVGVTVWCFEKFSTKSDVEEINLGTGKKIVEMKAYVDEQDRKIVTAVKEVQTGVLDELKGIRADAKLDSINLNKTLNDIYSRLPRNQASLPSPVGDSKL